MRGEHMLGLLFFAVSTLFPTGGKLGAGSAALIRPGGACHIEVENVIQSEFGEELLIALIGIQDAQ